MAQNFLPFYRLLPSETERVDAVRGFLCFYIFAFHFYAAVLERAAASYPVWRALLIHGYVAVNIFFAVSGFLLFHSLSRILREGEPRPWIRFYVKRFFRIFPAWFVALIIYSIHRGRYDVADFLRNLFFVFGLTPFKFEEITVLHSWSLYVEVIYFLAFPLLIFCLRKKLLPYLLLLFLLSKYVFDYVYVPRPGYLLYTPFNCFPYFIYGAAAYIGLEWLRKVPFSRPAFYFFLASPVFVAFHIDFKPPLIEFYILFWFIFIIAGPPEFAAAFNALFRRLGRYCYSFYLIHLICVQESGRAYRLLFSNSALPSAAQAPLQMSLAFAMTCAGAAVLYHLVEEPFIRLGQRIGQSTRPA